MTTAVLIEVEALEDELAGRAAAPGLLPLCGRPTVTYPARALRACGNVDRLVLAGPRVYDKHSAALDEVDQTVLADGPLGDLVDDVLERCGDGELLFWPANAPLLTVDMVERFLAGAPLEAAATWSVVREERVVSAFPGHDRGAAHNFAGDRLMFGGLGCVRADVLAPKRATLRRLLGRSVSKSELVKMLGVGFAIKVQNGRASLEELVERVAESVGAPCVAEILPDPELAFRVRSRHEHHVARDRMEAG